MIDLFMTVIVIIYFWDVSRGEVETPSLFQGRPSFLVSKINSKNGTNIDETTSICFPEFILRLLRWGCMEDGILKSLCRL